jgi:uncharacterized repeat protein (TIGR04076 family)
MNLIIKVKEVKGNCPVYRQNDSFILKDGYKLVSKIPLCMHSLSSIMPFYNALRISGPDSIGIAGKKDKKLAYLQCPDVCSYTNGGTAVFEISKEDKKRTAPSTC